jgi:hypothetical protein
MNTPISAEGTLSPTLKEVLRPLSKLMTKITNIRFANEVASSVYTLELYKKNYRGELTLLYKFELDPGDVVTDDTHYNFDNKTSLWAKSSNTHTEYNITGFVHDNCS